MILHVSRTDLSYTLERHRVGRQVLNASGAMVTMTAVRQPLIQAIRNHLMAELSRRGFFQRGMGRFLSELAIGYRASPVNGQTSRFRGRVRAGDRAPDGMLADGRRLFEAWRNDRFVVLSFGAPTDMLEWLRGTWQMTVYEAGPDLTTRYGAFTPSLLLVRPDGYVGVAAEMPVSQERLGLWFSRLGALSSAQAAEPGTRLGLGSRPRS